jgi:hypothetical protein
MHIVCTLCAQSVYMQTLCSASQISKAEEALRAAWCLEAEYQWALGQVGLRAAVAASMQRLATHCCLGQPFEGLASSFAGLATTTMYDDEGRLAEAIKAAYQRYASTMEFTSTTARLVPTGAAQADLIGRMSTSILGFAMPLLSHPYGARDGLTTPAGSWVVH